MGCSVTVVAGAMIFPLRPLCGAFTGCAAAFASAAAFLSSSLLALLDFDFIREKSAMVSAKRERPLKSEMSQDQLGHSNMNDWCI